MTHGNAGERSGSQSFERNALSLGLALAIMQPALKAVAREYSIPDEKAKDLLIDCVHVIENANSIQSSLGGGDA